MSIVLLKYLIIIRKRKKESVARSFLKHITAIASSSTSVSNGFGLKFCNRRCRCWLRGIKTRYIIMFVMRISVFSMVYPNI